jgi:hypothetical protein
LPNVTVATSNGTVSISIVTVSISNGTVSISNVTVSTSNVTVSTSNGTVSTSNVTVSISNGNDGVNDRFKPTPLYREAFNKGIQGLVFLFQILVVLPAN